MGADKEVTAWPLSFRQYLSIMGVKVDRSNDPLRDMKRIISLSGRIKRNFREYLKTGGYPLPINRDPRSMEYSIRSLEGEILRAGRDLSMAKAIISSILSKAPSSLSYSSIGSDISISHRTVREYLYLLEGLMILGQALLKEGRKIAWRKERKFFFLDPFMANSLAMWSATPYLESALYE